MGWPGKDVTPYPVTGPILYGLKFVFLGALYVFLFWVLRHLVVSLEPPRQDSTKMCLVVEQGHAKVVKGTRSLDLDGPVTIGRAPDNSLQIEDPFCSARHARLSPHQDGFLLEDLDSKNGVEVGQQPVSGSQLLRTDDSFAIGEVVLSLKKKSPG